jgi:hypothetical protein
MHKRRRLRAAAFALAVAALHATAVHAQDEKKPELEVGRWYNSIESGLNLTQSAYSDNWHGGETNSLAWTAFLNAGAQRRFTNGIDWASRLRLRFGQTHQQQKDADGNRSWDRPQKSEDKIDFETLALLSKGWKIDPYLSGRWESQFIDQSDATGRDIYVNPSTFKESAGIARHFLQRGEEEFFLTRFGWTQRQNYRRYYLDATSDATDSKLAHDGGVELQADWRLKILQEKVAWLGKFTVYQPFAWSETETFDRVSADSLVAAGIDADVKDYSTVVDAVWENTFTTQVTKWIAFNIYVEFRYDKYDNSVVPIVNDAGDNLENAGAVADAIRKDVQWKQTFGIGITYRFM